jgi:hypothetical protein
MRSSQTTKPKTKDGSHSKHAGRFDDMQWPTAPPLRSDGSVVVLHVAEKPSIASAIASSLCGKKGRSLGTKGERGTTPVHEFVSVPFTPPGEHQEVRCTHRVTSVVGHVFSTDFPPQYQYATRRSNPLLRTRRIHTLMHRNAFD